MKYPKPTMSKSGIKRIDINFISQNLTNPN